MSSRSLVFVLRCACLSLLALSLLAAGQAVACIVIPVPPPRPDIKPLYLQVQSQHVETNITDQVARTTVTTVLHNPHDRRVEGTFIFPVPANASVSSFSYWNGDKEMKGELLDKDKARKVYEDIVRTLRDPALLEYEGAGLFKASIFPIPAGGDAKTKLEFTQVLKAEGGIVQYTHAVKLGHDEPNHGKLVIDVNIRSQVPIKSVYSPTHKIEVVRKSDTSVAAGLELDDTDFNCDFQLFYTMTEKDFGINVLTHRESGEPGYFMLLLAPKQEWGKQEIEGKDVVFVLDTSGSMQGEKLDQAKKAFTYCLKALKPDDRFGLITFATATRHFEDGLLKASPANVKRATDFVADTEASGATALNDALVEALGLIGKPSDRPAMVIFLTDGLPTVGERDTDRILANVAKANKTTTDSQQRLARTFIFGVGDDVNTHLLDQIAEANGGSTNYVRPKEDIEAAVSSLYLKLSHPVLSNLALKLDGINSHDLYPQKLPDLFLGSQLAIVGRYDTSGPDAITLTGTARGQEKRFTYEANFPQESAANPFLARVWAVRRIGYLLDQIRLNGENKELRDEVVKLAVRFGIVTPYTSYLVQEDKPLIGIRPGTSAAFGESMPAAAGMPGAPAEALKAETGAGAVHAARNIGAMKDQAQVSESGQAYRSVGQRTFYFDGEYWTDATYDADEGFELLRHITAYSPAYFALLQARPELGAVLALGEKVKVRIGGIGLEISPAGSPDDTLPPEILDRLNKE